MVVADALFVNLEGEAVTILGETEWFRICVIMLTGRTSETSILKDKVKRLEELVLTDSIS